MRKYKFYYTSRWEYIFSFLLFLAGLGSILETVSKILKDTAIFVIYNVSKIHFTLRVSYHIFQILHQVKDTDTLKLCPLLVRPMHTHCWKC